MTHRPKATPKEILDQISQNIKDLRQLNVGPRWIVAVSGGADSVALLRALSAVSDQVDLSITVAHLHHGIRGDDATADARFVEELAESLGLPFELGHWRPTRPTHFEADARVARYRWLTEVALRLGAHAIATAHHRDDQAETILHRILRGTGLHGLMGMSPYRNTSSGVALVRPVLGVSRADLLVVLDALGQPYRTDATNLVLDGTRNRIRLDLLPKLAAQFNPRVVEALIGLGEAARRESVVSAPQLVDLERLITLSSDAEKVCFDVVMLRRVSLSSRLKLLRRSWRTLKLPEKAMTATHWLRMARFIDRADGRLTLPGGGLLSVEKTVATLSIHRSQPRHADRETIPVTIPGTTELAGGLGRFLVSMVIDETYDEVIDADRVEPPLVVDSPRPGDRFDPLGMDGQTMPLADFLRGRRLKSAERAQVPILRDSVGIVWVMGHRISERVKQTGETRRRLGLRWEHDPTEPDRHR